jgi:hypothetical protein
MATAGGSANFLTLALQRQDRATQELGIAQENMKVAEAALPPILSDVAAKRAIVSQRLSEYNRVIQEYGIKSLEAERANQRLSAAQDAVNDSLMQEAEATLNVISTRGELNDATNELAKSTENYNFLLKSMKDKSIPGLVVGLNSVQVQAQTTAAGIQSTVGTTTNGLLVLNGKVGSLQNTVAGAKTYVGNTLQGLQSQADRLNTSINQLQNSNSGPLKVKARATGGPVTNSQPYMVGEKGPELFVPSTSGKIINADETGKSGDRVTMSNVFNIFNQTDLDASIRELGWRLAAA